MREEKTKSSGEFLRTLVGRESRVEGDRSNQRWGGKATFVWPTTIPNIPSWSGQQRPCPGGRRTMGACIVSEYSIGR